MQKGVRPPPSLQNIFKEAINDVAIDPPRHGYLKCWAEQGVLMLNAVLTVREGEANSHARHGWEELTDAIILTHSTQNEGLVFLLWGNPAAKKASGVDGSRYTQSSRRVTHRRLEQRKLHRHFLDSRCFSRMNEALVRNEKEPIDYNVV